MKRIIIILVLSALPLYPLFSPGLPITHDGADHVARIANFYSALSDGVIIPRWAQFLNWGYGHPILMFLYPFSSYTASFFHFLGFSYIDSLKIIFGLGYVASGVTMYLWAKEQFGKDIGLTASLLYIYAPYRFIDLYVRGAIGEHMAFIFPPLILYFILLFTKSNEPKKSYLYLAGIAVSFAFLLLSHNAISLMFLPVLAVYGVYLYFTNRNSKKLIYLFLFLCWGLVLSGFFTFPAFFEGKFTLRDIVTGDEYKTRFVDNPIKFVYGNWNYGITGQFSVQLGIAHLIGLLFLPFIFLRRNIKKKTKTLLLLFTLLLVLSLFLQLSVSNFLYEIVTTLKKFQFPWRFLSLSLFATAVLASSSLFLLPEKKRFWGVVLAALLIIGTSFPHWRAKGYFIKSDSFYESIYRGTTDTGESAPVWSVRFMEKEPRAHMEVISGTANVQNAFRSSVFHKYTVTVGSEIARMRENTLYFPGWHVFVNGQPVEIQFQDPSERGLITFGLSQGKNNVEIIFKDTKLRMMSNALSIISAAALLIGGLYTFLKYKYVKEKK